MGDEPFKTQHETSTSRQSRPSSHSTTPHQLAYATERARLLFGSYRRGDANDPEIYVRAVTAVLACYDFELMREVTDPRTGIMTTEKYMSFMPNPGELKVYCDGVAAVRDRIRHLGSLPTPDFTRLRLPAPPAAPGDYANIFVPDTHRRYATLVEWTKTGDVRCWKFGRSSDNRAGIWVALDIWDPLKLSAAAPTKSTEPQTWKLSDIALKTMQDIDAERFGTVEQSNSEVA